VKSYQISCGRIILMPLLRMRRAVTLLLRMREAVGFHVLRIPHFLLHFEPPTRSSKIALHITKFKFHAPKTDIWCSKEFECPVYPGHRNTVQRLINCLTNCCYSLWNSEIATTVCKHTFHNLLHTGQFYPNSLHSALCGT